MTGYRRAGLGVAVITFAASVGLEFYFSKPSDKVAILFITVWLGLLLVVGSLVVIRRPGHRVGILLVATAPLMSVADLTKTYAQAVLLEHRDLPLGKLSAWLSSWTTLPAFVCLLLAVLLFPSGRLPSRRWRWLPWVMATTFSFSIASVAFRPGQIDGLPGVANPVGTFWGDRIGDFENVFGLVIALLVVAVVVSLFLRLRRSEASERQQVKWLVYAVGMVPLLFLLSQFVMTIDNSEEEYLGFLVIMAGLIGIPVSLGIGILRYRLYDIDVVINRTLVYGLLTGILAGGYLGLVVALQAVLPTQGNQLAVAGSTLAVAALFGPLRRRIQSFIDRRFYRSRYDASATLDHFSARLRDQVDLDSLNRELVEVVTVTMQPTHASLWLRESGR